MKVLKINYRTQIEKEIFLLEKGLCKQNRHKKTN